MTTEASTKRPIAPLSGPALPFWRRIRWNLILYFVVLAVIPVAVIVSLVVTELQSQAQRQVTDQLNSVVTLKTQLIDQWLSDSQAVLFTLTASDAEDQRLSVLATLQGAEFERDQAIVNGILQESIKTTNLFDEIFFYDLNGKIQASSDSTAIPHVVTRQPYYTPSLTAQFIQSPYYEVGSGQLTALVTYPVRDVNGQIVGVLAGRLNLDVLGQIMLQRTGLPGSGETYLVSAQSNYLLTPSRFEGYEQTRAYHSTGIDRALAGQDGSGNYNDYRDPPVRVIGVYRWIPELQAALMAEVDQSQALSAFNNARLNSLLLTIAGALLAVLAGLYAATRFSRPIMALTETATHIASGDLSERATVRQRNELGVLGAAFNEMADQLQRSISSLEERVAARTRDLFLTLEVGQLATRVYQQTDLLQRVADFIRERFDLYYTQIYLLDDLHRYAVLAAGTGEVGEQLLDRKHRLDLSQTSIVASATHTQRPVLVADTENDPIHRPNPLLPETRSEVAIPLIAGGEVIGVLDMQAHVAQTFRADNLPVFEAMANQLASAVRSAQSYAETQAAVDRADEINRRLTGEAWTSYLGRLGQGEAVGYEYDLQRVTPLAAVSVVEPPSGNGHDHNLALPVALRGQSIGTIQVEEADHAREWTPEDVELVRDVADRVALAVEQFRAFDETQVALVETETQAQRLADLNEMAAQLSAASNLNDVYRITAIWTNRVLHGDRASLALLAPNRDSFEIFGLDGMQGAISLGAHLPRKGTWVGEVIDGRRVRRLDDLRNHPYPEAHQLAEQGLCSSLNVPLVVGNEIIGTLNVASQRAHAFGTRDEALIRQIASLLTSHLQTQQLFAQTQKRASEMEAVAIVGAEASATLDPDVLLWNVANLVKERFNLYHTHIYLLDVGARALVLAAGAGEVGRLMVSQAHQIPLTHQHSLVSRAVRSRAGVIANDVAQAPDFLPNPMLPDTHSELAVPMIVGDRVIGVLDVQSDKAGYFTVGDQQVFSTLAAQIAVAVQNARSFAESQQRLAIIETASSAIVLGTLDGEILYLNPFGAQMLGYDPDEIASLTMAATQPPDTVARFEDEILPIVFTQGLWHGENVLLTKDGREIPVDQTAFLLRDDEGQPQFLAAIMNDITERRRAEQALRVSEERMRTVLENMPVMLDAVDEDLRIIVWNRECERVTGYSADEIISHPNASELLYPDPDYRDQMQSALAASGDYRDWEWDTTCKDGSVKTIAWFNISEEYPIPGWAKWGIGVDITERKRAEEIVRRRAADMEAMAQVGAEAAATLDVQEMMWNVSNLTQERFGLYHVHIYLTDSSGATLVLSAGSGPVGQTMVRAGHHIPLSHERSLVARAARMRRAVIENDVTIAEGFLPNPMLPRTRSEMAVPLMMGDRAIGVLDVQSDQVRRFTGEDYHVFSTLASQVAVSVQNARLFEQAQRRAAEMQAVSEVSVEASATLDPTELLQNIVNLANEQFGLYHSHVYLMDETGDNLVLAAGAGRIGQMMVQAGHRIGTAHERSLVARAARRRQGVIANDVAASPDFLPNPMLPATRAELAVPMIVGDQVIGVFDVQSDEIDHFTDEDLIIQTTLASQVAVAVNNARLFEQTQRRAAEMQAVAEVGAEASATLDQQSLLENVVDLVKDRFGFYHVHIYLLDDSGRSLILRAGADEPGRLMVAGGHRIPLRHEQSLVVRAVRTRKSVIVNDVTRAPDFLPNPMLPKTRAELATPLMVGGQVIGVLDVQSDQVNRFSPEDEQVQSTLASQIAVAVNNAQLFAEQIEVADRLREVDRLKSEFLASMSHELRTPLNSIIGYAEVLLDGIDGELTDDMNEDVGAIHGSGKHLLNLINDILDLAKIEAGQMDLVIEPFELGPLAEDTAGIQRVLLKDKPVDLVLDIPDDLPQLNADPLRVRQVMNNLITNAIKFTEQGSITVRAREYEQDPALLLISVIDTGMGMRSDQIPVIFDRFRQVDQSHTRRAGGTGLGLSITRQLVQMHGGDIWVESEPGVGSAFHFTLPIALATAEE